MEENIDEDIKILEETIKHYKAISKNLYDVYLGANNKQSEDYMKKAIAISNVLSELKTYKDKCIELATNIDALETDLKEGKQELGTYKKIAELMADFINMYTLSGEEHHYCHKTMSCEVVGGSRSCIDCIIDWARKEVEKDGK